ncbi:MAG: GNAT superfamily N-acetyltransferase [Bacillariaceae sp.]|jgi:GNAT superfamily N-acetyltransferase
MTAITMTEEELLSNDSVTGSRKKKQAQRRRNRPRFLVSSPPLLLVLLVILIAHHCCPNDCVVDGFSVSFGLGAVFFQPKGLITKSTRGDIPTLLEASNFFVDAFWIGKPGGGATELSDKQRRSLSTTQFGEFRSRYAGRTRPGQAELVICQLPDTGEITGCAGIEVSPIPYNNDLKSTKTYNGPLMSNLAVSKQFRRKGIAEKLVKEVERIVRIEWGYDDCYLYVEERNKAGVKLYQKLGYKKMWIDKDATTLLPSTNGKLENSSTNIVCMRKRLNLGLLGRILPF